MKKVIPIFILLTFLFCSCGGSLSEDQRKRLKDGMEQNTIKKVSEAQITEAAFELGRSLANTIEKFTLNNKKQIDSLQRSNKIKIVILHPGDAMLLDLEQQIVEAYTAGSDSVVLNDNVQKIGTDSLLYTRPVMKESKNGAVEFAYALGIHLSKKQVVLSIKD